MMMASSVFGARAHFFRSWIEAHGLSFMDRATNMAAVLTPNWPSPSGVQRADMFAGAMADDRLAAVLVGLIECNNALHVLMTRRAAHLPAHAGQISFPGGKIERGDAGPVSAALREAMRKWHYLRAA